MTLIMFLTYAFWYLVAGAAISVIAWWLKVTNEANVLVFFFWPVMVPVIFIVVILVCFGILGDIMRGGS